MAMPVPDFLDLLNNDLANEYKHFHFYLHSAMMVQGLHRAQIRAFLLAEAQSEMLHVQQFGDLILGLGATPSTKVNGFRSDLSKPVDILTFALSMEEEVVANYVARKKQATDIGGVVGTRVEIFLDSQIEQSASDADDIRQMLRGL